MEKEDKYKLARQFKQGCCACLSGKAIDLEQPEAFNEGYEWAYRYVRPMLDSEANRYVVSKGFKPFCSIEALRKEA